MQQEHIIIYEPSSKISHELKEKLETKDARFYNGEWKDVSDACSSII